MLVVLALLLPPYNRHQLVAGGSIFMQALALGLLSTLFTEGSEFYRISSLAHVGSVFNSAGFSPRGATKLAVD